MEHLHNEEGPVISAHALGTLRSDGSDSILPVKRILWPSLAHHLCKRYVPFTVFLSTLVYMPCYFQISRPPDYRLRLQTGYVLFGTKWAKLFPGPV